MRNWRRSHPRGFTAPSGSWLKALGWSGARFATALRSAPDSAADSASSRIIRRPFMKVCLYYIGRARDRNAGAIAEEYIKRTQRFALCEMREIKPLRSDPWQKHASALKVLLDPAGRALDSARFTALVSQTETNARDLVFIIGG